MLLTLKAKPTNRRTLQFVGYCIAFVILFYLIRDVYKIVEFSDRGLDLSDESFYLLSYDTKEYVGRSFTGATWIFGAIYELLDKNISHLRILKVFALILSGGFFGSKVYSWLYSYTSIKSTIKYDKPTLFGFKLAVIFGSALSALAPYVWTPATPNYNDLNLIALFLIAGISITLLKPKSVKVRPYITILSFGILGFLFALDLFVKFSSALALLIVLLLIFAYQINSFMSAFKYIGAFVIGFIFFWLFLQVLITNIFNTVPNSIDLIKVVSADGYSPLSLISFYCSSIKDAFKILYADYKYFFLIVFLLPISIKKSKLISLISATIFIALVKILFTKETFIQGGPIATVQNGRLFIFSVLIISLVVFIGDFSTKITIKHLRYINKIAQIRQIPRPRTIRIMKCVKNELLLQKILFILILLPFIHAAGSNNDIFVGSSLSVLSWILVIVVLAVRINLSNIAKYSLILLAVFGVWGMHIKILDGFLEKPYRLAASPKNLNKTVDGLPNVSNIKFDKATVDYLSELRDIRNDAGYTEDAVILGFFDLSGEVFALGGKSPGEPWYFNTTPNRNISNIQYACSQKQIGKNAKPMILISKEMPMELLAELDSCGLNYPANYRLAGSALSPYSLIETKVYVPIK